MTIFDDFRAHANSEVAEQMSIYMRNQFPFLGLKSPERRALSRDFLRSRSKAALDWNFVKSCWAQPEREFQYLALDLIARYKKSLKTDDLKNLTELVITKSWWDTVDGLDRIFGELAVNFPETVKPLLLDWSLDDNFWKRRLAIDHQLLRREDTDTALLAQILENNLNQTEFFINKAMGWALRDFSKTNPDWVRCFLSEHEQGLSALTKKEASKYL